MKEPGQLARQVEEHPRLPAATCERVSGYGVMGLPFHSGHVLGLRRWTASSVGQPFTSIWHRNPQGRWTFYESVPADIACSRYFGASVEQIRVGPIRLDWQGDRRLRIRTVDADHVDWSVELESTPVTRAMSLVGSALPAAAWRSRPVLSVMGAVAGRALRVGTVKLTGATSNRQRFDANPLRIWRVTHSYAVVDGEELGPPGPLAEQAHLSDFYIPQRGVFAVGRVFVTPVAASATQAAELSDATSVRLSRSGAR
jgi:hypothetical protein